MNIVLNMPTMRFENWPRIIDNILSVMIPEVNLVWQPVLTIEEIRGLTTSEQESIDAKWITPIAMLPDTDLPIVSAKCNTGVDYLYKIGYEGYIHWSSDDNLLPRCFCRRFLEGDGKGVIVASHKRGQGRGASGHGTHDLLAQPDSMRVGCVSGEQYLIHTSVLGGRRYKDGICSDGMIIESLYKERPDDFHFIPDFFIPFNALEPGRWEPDKLAEVLNVE